MKDRQELKAITQIDADGKMLAIASDDSNDRMGDSLDIKKWDLRNFKKNPVLLAGHINSPEYVIGVAKKMRIEGNRLLFEPEFHKITELARNIGQMFKEEVLKAWSVGFMPGALMNPEDKDAKNELLEVSAVAVPANANALMAEAKAYTPEKLDEVKDWVGGEIKENKEDANETISEELSDDEKRKKKYELFSEIDKIMWAFYKVYMNKDTEVEKFSPLLDEAIKLLESISKGKKAIDGENIKLVDIEDKVKQLAEARELIINEVKEIEKEIEVEEKEGKVISKKNRDNIMSAIEQIKNTASALENLLEITEVPKEMPVEAPKVVKTKPIVKLQPTEKQIVTRVLQKIAGNSNLALKKLKQ